MAEQIKQWFLDIKDTKNCIRVGYGGSVDELYEAIIDSNPRNREAWKETRKQLRSCWDTGWPFLTFRGGVFLRSSLPIGEILYTYPDDLTVVKIEPQSSEQFREMLFS